MKKLTLPFAAACALAMSGPAASSDDLERAGDVLQIASPAYALFASGRLNGRSGALACAKAIVLTNLATQTLKFAIDAPRPNGGGRGFPSGHTSSAAVGFGCMLGQEGWTTTTLALGAATALTGYSRVESDLHDWPQVGAGFALGTAVGYYSTRHLRDRTRLDYAQTRDGRHLLIWRMDF